MNYDRLYDEGYLALLKRYGIAPCNCRNCKVMREPGLEPGSLTAPDPKSRGTALAQPLAPAERHSTPRGTTEKQRDYDQYYDERVSR